MGVAAPPGWLARLGWGGGWTPGFLGGEGLIPTRLLAGLSLPGWCCLGEGLKANHRSQWHPSALEQATSHSGQARPGPRVWLLACQGLGPIQGLILSGVRMGVGQRDQLFFMSLTGNSIPTKFTPFGSIQKEQDRVQKTEESAGEGSRQMLGTWPWPKGFGLAPPCFAPNSPCG